MITLGRIFAYGIQGFRRNLWLSLIAIITMVFTLVTMTIFFLSNVVAIRKYQEINEKIDYVIFINDTASDQDVTSFYDQLQARTSEVKSSSILTKEEVRERFETEFAGDEDLRGIITEDNNPLPRQVNVKFNNPDQVESFDVFVRQSKFTDIVYRTSYQANKGEIENYRRVTGILRIVGIFLSVFFTAVSVLVILNTIRLAIFARREEIEVMRLVGATSGYIRGPFLIEGVLFGVLGALLSGIVFWVLLQQLQNLLQNSFNAGTTNTVTQLLGSSFSQIIHVQGFNSLFLNVLAIQLAAGLLLGISCSFVAARRYLREQ